MSRLRFCMVTTFFISAGTRSESSASRRARRRMGEVARFRTGKLSWERSATIAMQTLRETAG